MSEKINNRLRLRVEKGLKRRGFVEDRGFYWKEWGQGCYIRAKMLDYRTIELEKLDRYGRALRRQTVIER